MLSSIQLQAEIDRTKWGCETLKDEATFWRKMPCGLIIMGYMLFKILNTLQPRQNGCHFPDNLFKCIFLNENAWVSIKISLTFIPKCPINNIPTLAQKMAWHGSGDKPLPEPMMVSLLTHICITRPQCVKIPHRPPTKVSHGVPM